MFTTRSTVFQNTACHCRPSCVHSGQAVPVMSNSSASGATSSPQHWHWVSALVWRPSLASRLRVGCRPSCVGYRSHRARRVFPVLVTPKRNPCQTGGRCARHPSAPRPPGPPAPPSAGTCSVDHSRPPSWLLQLTAHSPKPQLNPFLLLARLVLVYSARNATITLTHQI